MREREVRIVRERGRESGRSEGEGKRKRSGDKREEKGGKERERGRRVLQINLASLNML